MKPQKPEHHSLTVELSVLTFHVNVFSLVCFDGWWLALPPEKAPAFAARELQSRTPASTGPCLCSTAALRKPGVGTIHFKVGIMEKTSLLSHWLEFQAFTAVAWGQSLAEIRDPTSVAKQKVYTLKSVL